MPGGSHGIGPTGRYSPLRYPGGKGKLAKFMAAVVRANGLSDGRYIEPYAGGAGIAWELLITGVVATRADQRHQSARVRFLEQAYSTTPTISAGGSGMYPCPSKNGTARRRSSANPEDASTIDLGFSFFYLNRTNRSGILNGGLIGGRNQQGKWRMDARFNREDLIHRNHEDRRLRRTH